MSIRNIKKVNGLTDYISIILSIGLIIAIWKMITGFGTIIGISPKTIVYIDTCAFSLFIIGSLVGIVTFLISNNHSPQVDDESLANCDEYDDVQFDYE